MGSLKDFYKRTGIKIEKSKAKGFEDDLRLADEDEDEEIEPDPRRGRHLQNLYTAFKARFEKNKFRVRSKSPSIIGIFNKAAGRLNEHERQTHDEIDDRLFVVALFMKYGKDTYPGHLLGKAAIDIYYKKLEELCHTTYVPKKDEDVDQKLLEHLCKIRRETKEQVMAALKDAKIFSDAFIKKWKAAHKRRV
jgi:hypothetical protein